MKNSKNKTWDEKKRLYTKMFHQYPYLVDYNVSESEFFTALDLAIEKKVPLQTIIPLHKTYIPKKEEGIFITYSKAGNGKEFNHLYIQVNNPEKDTHEKPLYHLFQI